jgi:hypothetical protein
MEVTVKINTETPVGRRLIKQLQRYPESARFETPATTEIPEGYVTLEEFREEAKKRVRNLLNTNGIH